MDAQFFVFRWGVKLCVYHLGLFTVSIPRDKIETTGAVPGFESGTTSHVSQHYYIQLLTHNMLLFVLLLNIKCYVTYMIQNDVEYAVCITFAT